MVAADIDKPALDAALAGVIAEGLSVETRHQDVTDRAAWDGLVDDIAAMAGEPQLAAYSAAKA